MTPKEHSAASLCILKTRPINYLNITIDHTKHMIGVPMVKVTRFCCAACVWSQSMFHRHTSQMARPAARVARLQLCEVFDSKTNLQEKL